MRKVYTKIMGDDHRYVIITNQENRYYVLVMDTSDVDTYIADDYLSAWQAANLLLEGIDIRHQKSIRRA